MGLETLIVAESFHHPQSGLKETLETPIVAIESIHRCGDVNDESH
jgi:hypothetical protein